MSLFVQLVVGEFELVKINDCVHPVRAEGRGFGVHVQPCWGTLFLKTLHPRRVLVFVTILVHGSHVHQENIVDIGVQVKDFNFD